MLTVRLLHPCNAGGQSRTRFPELILDPQLSTLKLQKLSYMQNAPRKERFEPGAPCLEVC